MAELLARAKTTIGQIGCSHDGHCSPQAVQLLVRGRESERAEEAVSNARDAPVGRRRDRRRAGLPVRELVGAPGGLPPTPRLR